MSLPHRSSAGGEGGAPHNHIGLHSAAMNPPEQEDRCSVPEFFKGKGILVTGGTGFLGKVLIEKLLRCCPGVGQIFVLLRPSPKAGKSAEERLRDEILGSKCFDRLRDAWPSFASQCIPVGGDVGSPKLGMSESSLQEVVSKVNVVFHCAATVKFNEHLKTAFNINVDGISNLLDVCRSLRRLDALVHVSTAYVNAPDHSNELISEHLRPMPVDVQSLRAKIDGMTMEKVSAETNAILEESGRWPNSYTLTKCVAEHVLSAERGSLPVIIVRPSIVTCALSEPMPGWMDSLVGPAGLLHTAPGREEMVVDFVPVDLVINALLAAAW
eukprot:CAMPEP_0181299832 /NCGR_PEP_ID=MMETSP1101-20121128/6563_1 /TAXON_ID=46948 /ORGANISM="Rhodomonas abbreviata, Strain Caron Lab Isolate" /LENGTH=325 /DNA_ID=CAMNT_0023405021 /DNA_START=219 /DNA_END=1193 /DNA_ORIENTATION=-